MLSLEEARRLMEEWTLGESLRVHMESVSLCLAAYARRLAPAEEERWAVTGLLHDFDYERHPTADAHPMVGVAHLRSLGVDEEVCTAILGHADYTGTPRETPLARALFAVDELAGFVVACAKVRPRGIADLQPKSVQKKLKDKAFAAAVSREDIRRGAEELEVDFTEHLRLCIDAIRSAGARLGLVPGP